MSYYPSLLESLTDILVAKVAYDSDISEQQLRAHPMFWECMNNEETSLDETIDQMIELAYCGELRFNFEEEGV
jgi:hypothetical protein